ncbi:MAG: hypothetical protein II778_09950, partial [Anaerovibrio sp.]|nr:hypothetical protein [Anaerovibrio sp.]
MKIRTNIKKAILLAGVTTIAVSGTIFAAPDVSQEKTSLDAEVVEYDMNTGMATASGNVIMIKGEARVTGDYAEFDVNYKDGKVSGNVVATKEDMRVTADLVSTDGSNHII